MTFAVTISDPTEAVLVEDYPALLFTPENYLTGQEVTVQGIADNLADGDVIYYLQFSLLTSDDPFYYNKYALTHPSFTLTNQDGKAPLENDRSIPQRHG